MSIKSIASIAIPAATILGLIHFFLGSQQVLEINRLNTRIRELEIYLSRSNKVTESAKKAVKKRDQQVQDFCKKYAK